MLELLLLQNFSWPAANSIIVTETDGSTVVAEGGAYDSYSISITDKPTLDVTISVNPAAGLLADKTELIFTAGKCPEAGNWCLPQTVTVNAVDDRIAEGNRTDVIKHLWQGGDINFNKAIADVNVNRNDNDVTISDLQAKYPNGSIVKLIWTSIGGSSYDIRYSTSDLPDDAACTAATQFTTTRTPAAAGTAEKLWVIGLNENTKYYFCVRASGLSSSVVWQKAGVTATTLTAGAPVDNLLSHPGEFIPNGSGGLACTGGVIFGPDGNMYVASYGSNKIIKYDGITGNYLGDFVASGSGGLQSPWGITFGPNGNLYVANEVSDKSILEYSGVDGSFVRNFVDVVVGPMGISRYFSFGPDNNLYVVNLGNNKVLRYDGTTGAFMGEFTSGYTFNVPGDVIFDANGYMYVSNSGTNQILRFNGTTGAFIDVFASGGGMNFPIDLLIGPNGNLFVASYYGGEVHEFNGTTGAYIRTIVPHLSGGLTQLAEGIAFGEDGNLYVGHGCASPPGNEVLRYIGP